MMLSVRQRVSENDGIDMASSFDMQATRSKLLSSTSRPLAADMENVFHVEATKLSHVHKQ